MNFTIRINKLGLPVRLGWLAAEREKPQPVHFDIELELVAPKVIHTDDLDDTVDYMKVVNCVEQLTQAGSWRMNEKMCFELAASILELSAKIIEVRVGATKDVVSNASGVTASVKVTR